MKQHEKNVAEAAHNTTQNALYTAATSTHTGDISQTEKIPENVSLKKKVIF